MKRYFTSICIFVLMLIPLNGSAEKFPGGPVANDQIIFQYAIYLIEPHTSNPVEKAKKLLREKYDRFTLTEKPVPKISSVRIRLSNKVKSDYAPPSLESLRYSGKGISKEEAEKLQKATSAVIIDFSIPLNSRIEGIHEASQFMSDLALLANGIIWDEETRQCFGRMEWVKSRIQSSENNIPDISKHITIHAYKDNDYIRAITLGMVKFGLPDIEVSDFLWSYNRDVGSLINLLAQQLYETNTIKNSGEFILNVSNIKHKAVRSKLSEYLYSNAKSDVAILVVNGIRDEGDPRNRIIEVIFDNYPGKDKQEKIEAMLSGLWGWEDKLTYVKHNEEIIEASIRAKGKLPSIRNRILNGLAPGEYYLVKAPFKTPDGNNEWMWVEVISWKDKEKVTGLLNNHPYNVPNLKAGATVTVRTKEIFDYIHRLPDGTSEGNETGKLIEKYSERK